MAIDPCTATAPVKGVVRFVPADFKVAFPEFATVANGRLQLNFMQATLLLNNSCGSLVCDAVTRETLLNLLTAHVTALFDGVNGQAPAGIVGRLSNATEGSVSVGTEYPTNPDEAWYVQTQWGAMYWTATARWRSFRYIAPPPTCGDLYGPPVFGLDDSCGC